jgi:glyoxalase superfamily protein
MLGLASLQPLGPTGPFMKFQQVKEPKVGKVRIHVDVFVDDLEATVENVVGLGQVPT